MGGATKLRQPRTPSATTFDSRRPFMNSSSEAITTRERIRTQLVLP